MIWLTGKISSIFLYIILLNWKIYMQKVEVSLQNLLLALKCFHGFIKFAALLISARVLRN